MKQGIFSSMLKAKVYKLNLNIWKFLGWGNIVKVYGDVQEVDLYVGMLMEEPVPGMDLWTILVPFCCPVPISRG